MQGGVSLSMPLGEAACTSSAPMGQDRNSLKHCSTLHGLGTAAKDVFHQQGHACCGSLHTTDMIADNLTGTKHFALSMHVLHTPRPRRDPNGNQGVTSCQCLQCHSICTFDAAAHLYIAYAAMHAVCKSLSGARDPCGWLQSHHGPCWAPHTMIWHADLLSEPGQLCSCRLVTLSNMAGLCVRFQPAIQPARMIKLSCTELKMCMDFLGLSLGILDQYCTISEMVRSMLHAGTADQCRSIEVLRVETGPSTYKHSNMQGEAAVRKARVRSAGEDQFGCNENISSRPESGTSLAATQQLRLLPLAIERCLHIIPQQQESLVSHKYNACIWPAYKLTRLPRQIMDQGGWMSICKPCNLLGGGALQQGRIKSARMHQFEDEELPMWPAFGTSLASTMQIHNALLAVERSLSIHSQQQDLLVSNLYNFPLPHVVLAQNDAII